MMEEKEMCSVLEEKGMCSVMEEKEMCQCDGDNRKVGRGGICH